MRNHNRRYKDSVFVDLFSEDVTAKDNFLSLYNALHGTDYHATGILKKLRLKTEKNSCRQIKYLNFRMLLLFKRQRQTLNSLYN